MLVKRFSSASSTIWAIEGLSLEYRFCRQPRRRKPSKSRNFKYASNHASRSSSFNTKHFQKKCLHAWLFIETSSVKPFLFTYLHTYCFQHSMRHKIVWRCVHLARALCVHVDDSALNCDWLRNINQQCITETVTMNIMRMILSLPYNQIQTFRLTESTYRTLFWWTTG